MSSQKEKLELTTNISIDDIYPSRVSSDGRSIRPVTGIDGIRARVATQNERYRMVEVWSEDDLEPTNEQRAAFHEARRFVEQLTNIDLSWVKLKQIAAKSSETLGAYSPIDRTVRLCLHEEEDAESSLENEYINELIATLVHELMHATAQGNARLLTLAHEGAKSSIHLVDGVASVDLRIPSLQMDRDSDGGDKINVNSFIEEAFAEEGAARWRKEAIEEVRQNGDKTSRLLGRDDLPPIPYRYIDAYEPYRAKLIHYHIADAAYPAMSIRALSDYTGVDLFQLILESRDPSKNASSRRALARTVESVQKGLYKILRDTPDTSESMDFSSREVFAAIAADRLRKAQHLGSSAMSA